MTEPAKKAPAKKAAAKAVAPQQEQEAVEKVDSEPLQIMTMEEYRQGNPPNIQDAILGVMAMVGAIRKSEMNRTPGASYNFRGVDTVVNAVQPAFLSFGVTISPKVLSSSTSRSLKDTNNGGTMLWADVVMQYTLRARDGSEVMWSAPGAAMDSSDKAIGKACSVAYRIAMLQGLCIPTDQADPDSESPGHDDDGYQTHGRGGNTNQQQNARQQPAQGQRGGNQRPDYQAQQEPTMPQRIRNYTVEVMKEFEWDRSRVAAKFQELYQKDWETEESEDLLKAFGSALRDDAVTDKALEEAEAVKNVMEGLGGTVVGTPEDEPEPTE